MNAPDKNFGFLIKAQITGGKLPAYKGTITIDGTEYELGGWIKTSAKGETYLSLSATEKNPAYVKAKPAAKPKEEPQSGGLPF